MRQFLTLASTFGAASVTTPIYKQPFVIAAAVLVIAVIIFGVALFLFRSSGKKKGSASQPGANDWQRQPGAVQPGQQGWGGQPGQQGGWDAGAAQQQQAPWGMPAQQQPQQAPWGTPSSAGQQAAGWGMPAQQQPQQPAWGTPAASQQQGAWDAGQQQQAAGWGTPAPASQQPGGWGMPAQQPQQPAAGWGTPAQQQPSQPAWGAAGQGQSPQGQQNSWPGQASGASSWDQTAMPSSSPQDAWQSPAQGAAQGWGAQGNQQQAASAFGSNQPAQAWGQPAQADSWGQPSQQSAGAAWPGSAAQPSNTPPGGNQPVPAWQQQQAQPQAAGWGAPASAGQGFGASPFDNPDADRTMLRPMGTNQPGLGYVRIEEGKEPGRVYEVRKETLSIGRSRESDIFLEDLAVSRLHASIVNMGGGTYALRDEGSANGTKVNGQTVNKYQPYPLQEGDKIQLGQTVLVFARH